VPLEALRAAHIDEMYRGIEDGNGNRDRPVSRRPSAASTPPCAPR